MCIAKRGYIIPRDPCVGQAERPGSYGYPPTVGCLSTSHPRCAEVRGDPQAPGEAQLPTGRSYLLTLRLLLAKGGFLQYAEALKRTARRGDHIYGHVQVHQGRWLGFQEEGTPTSDMYVGPSAPPKRFSRTRFLACLLYMPPGLYDVGWPCTMYMPDGTWGKPWNPDRKPSGGAPPFVRVTISLGFASAP